MPTTNMWKVLLTSVLGFGDNISWHVPVPCHFTGFYRPLPQGLRSGILRCGLRLGDNLPTDLILAFTTFASARSQNPVKASNHDVQA